MKEKLYKPIIEDGDHLVSSKENPQRVRGVSQDKNNKTTNIIEWEEVEIEEEDYELLEKYDKSREDELTPAQQELIDVISKAISEVVIYGAGKFNEQIVQPWLKRSVRPWIKSKHAEVKKLLSRKNNRIKLQKSRNVISTEITRLHDVKVDEQIEVILNQAFDNYYFTMDSAEAEKHIMNLIYHILAVAYEIKILSNTVINNQANNENHQLENQAKLNKILINKVSNSIDSLLSDKNLCLDFNSSTQIFSLLGGGVQINGEYVPVAQEKLDIAINNMNSQREDKNEEH